MGVPKTEWIFVTGNTFKLKVTNGWIYRFNNALIFVQDNYTYEE